MTFNPTRFFNLVKRDFILNKKMILFGLIGCIAFFAFVLYTGHKSNGLGKTKFWIAWYAAALFAGGLILTTLIFWEFRSPAGRIQYLSFPASHLEKLGSRQFYSAVLYPGFMTLIFWILYSFYQSKYSSLSMGNAEMLGLKYMIASFFSAQALCMICAVFYNKYVPVKTILTAALVWVISMALLFMFFRIIFDDLFVGMSLRQNMANVTVNDNFKLRFEGEAGENIMRAFLIGLPPFMWLISYFKLKEKEV